MTHTPDALIFGQTKDRGIPAEICGYTRTQPPRIEISSLPKLSNYVGFT
jgi:hypothetical protein